MEYGSENNIFVLKMMMKSGRENYFEIPPCASCFLINRFTKYIEKHRVKNSVIKMAFFAHGGISIKLFVVYLHIINECLSYKFHLYSILTGHTKVESVAY